MPDDFSPGTPFRLSGNPLCPNIEGGPGSITTHEGRCYLLVAIAARARAEGLLSVEPVLEARLLADDDQSADSAVAKALRLVGQLAMMGEPEMALGVAVGMTAPLEQEWADHDGDCPFTGPDPACPRFSPVDACYCRNKRRIRWLLFLRWLPHALGLLPTGPDPKAIAEAVRVPWPVLLPWSPTPEPQMGWSLEFARQMREGLDTCERLRAERRATPS